MTDVQARASACMVEVIEEGGPARRSSGFVVAPGMVLTAAHTLDDSAGAPGRITMRGADGQGTVPGEIRLAPQYDLALVRIDPASRACVLFGGAVNVGDRVWMQGFVKKPGGQRLNPVLAVSEGEAVDELPSGRSLTLVKFKDGQVLPGMSGGPLLNLESSLVCGMVVRTRDERSALGGLAVPVRFILNAFPEIAPAQAAYHRENPAWRNEDVQAPEATASFEVRLRFVSKFPRGPAFPLARVPFALKSALGLLNANMSLELVTTANSLRVASDPDLSRFAIAAVTVGTVDPNHTGVPAFWNTTWNEAASKGPRMLAALICAAPPGALDGLDEVVRAFLADLRAHVTN